MDPAEAGRRAAHRLIKMLRDVSFPVDRHRLVEALGEKELEIGPGNVIRPARYLREAPDDEFRSPRDVAERLVSLGAIRAGGHSIGESEENATQGQLGTGTHHDSGFRREPPSGAADQSTAPPGGPSDTKGVRRPQS